tara:strand:- start:18959 stop:20620 length:1662 start_codon:yes stop_codon:yes gene_type:complete
MGIEKIGVQFEVNGKEAVKQIKDTAKALDNFNSELEKNREGMQILDQLTGGAVSQFQDYKNSVKGGIGAIKSLSKSFKGLKAAIISTGIGAIVVALGLIVAYWDDIKELVSGVSKEQEDLLELQQQSVAQSQAASDAISATSNTLKLQGKSERDILNLKKAQTDETIAALEAQLITQKEIKKAQVESAERNQNIAKGIIAFLSAPLLIITGLIDGITNSLASLGIIEEATSLTEDYLESTSSLLFDPEAVAGAADETIKETEDQLTKLKNTRDGFILQQQAQDQKAADDELQKKKDANQKLLDEEEAFQKKLADIKQKDFQDQLTMMQRIEDAENAYFDSKLSKEQLEENAVREKYFALIEAAKEYGLETTDLEAAQTEELQAIEDEAAARDEARDKALKKQRLSAVGDTFGQIAGILGKNSAAGKAAAIAQATINTYQGVSEIWGNKSTLPSPFDVIQKGVASIAVLQSGLQTVKQIKSVPKPKGVKGGGSSGGGGVGQSAPAFNLIGGTGTNQLAETIAEQTNKPSRSYVVAGDVTTAQELERNTVEGAAL